jgi:hypothetical protein
VLRGGVTLRFDGGLIGFADETLKVKEKVGKNVKILIYFI